MKQLALAAADGAARGWCDHAEAPARDAESARRPEDPELLVGPRPRGLTWHGRGSGNDQQTAESAMASEAQAQAHTVIFTRRIADSSSKRLA